MSGEAAVICDSGTMHDQKQTFLRILHYCSQIALHVLDDFVDSHDEGFEHCSFLTLYILSVQSSVNSGDCALQVEVDINSPTLEPKKRASSS